MPEAAALMQIATHLSMALPLLNVRMAFTSPDNLMEPLAWCEVAHSFACISAKLPHYCMCGSVFDPDDFLADAAQLPMRTQPICRVL